MTKHAQGHTISIYSGAGGAHLGFMGRPRVLMNKVGEGGGGGGSGGQGGEGGQEPALSEAAKGEVAKMVNEAVNGAVTNHLNRFKKSFTEEMTKTFGETLGPISEQLKALSESAKKPPGGDRRDPSDETKELLARYEGRIKELEQQNKAEREAREQEKQTRLREEERGQLAQVLRAKGLPDVTVKAAVALLHTEEKRVARTEDGKIVFKIEKGTGAGRYTDELEVEAGVDEWLKTDEGKGFLPARPAQGAGGQAARPNPGGQGGDKRAQATQDLARILLGGGGA